MRYVPWLLLPLAGFLLAYMILPTPPVQYQRVEVPVEVIVEREPATVRTFVDRIKTVEVVPRQVATARGGAADQVTAFCKPTLITDTLIQADTIIVSDPIYMMRSVSHSPGWFWARDHILLTGPTSTGDLVALDYDVRPGFTVRAVGSEALVQYPRTALLREVIESLLLAGAGFGLAKAF